MCYDWGTTIYAKCERSKTWKHAIFLGKNPYFEDESTDKRYLVIFEDDDFTSEVNDIRKACFVPKSNKNGFSWGERVEAWDTIWFRDEAERGIFLAKYSFPNTTEREIVYLIIPENSIQIPKYGFACCERIVD